MDKNLNKFSTSHSLPLISVITVVYNGSAMLEETILSVIHQSYSNVEYIIIDGGSTDGTKEIIEKHAEKISYWVSECDRGIYDAMNKGKAKAKGDFCIFLGADDVLIPGILQVVAPLMENKNAVYYGNILVKGTNKRYDGAFTRYKLCLTNICHQCIFYPRLAYQQLDYNLRYHLWADYAYNIELMGERKFEFIYIDYDITIFNDQGVGSLSSDGEFTKDKTALIRKNFGVFLNVIISVRGLLSRIKNSLIR